MSARGLAELVSLIANNLAIKGTVIGVSTATITLSTPKGQVTLAADGFTIADIGTPVISVNGVVRRVSNVGSNIAVFRL